MGVASRVALVRHRRVGHAQGPRVPRVGVKARAVIAVATAAIPSDVRDTGGLVPYGAEIRVRQIHQAPAAPTEGRGKPVPRATLAPETTRPTRLPPTFAAATAAARGVRSSPFIRPSSCTAPPAEETAGVAVPPSLTVQVFTAARATLLVRTEVAPLA